LAYDLESTTQEGRLRDFSGKGHHGELDNVGSLYPMDACYIGFESHQGEPQHQRLPFVGALDEVLVFSRALSLREIKAFSRDPH
jgi:hypothetical protein